MVRLEKMDLLVGLYVFCIATAELMGSKTVPLATIGGFHLTFSVAIFVLPLLFILNDVISEVYGRDRARSVAFLGIGFVFLLACFSALVVSLPPSSRFTSLNPAYRQIFGTSLRFSLASLVAFVCAELADVAVFARMRARWGSARLWLRVNVSNVLAQGIDTVIFMTVAFWSTRVSIHDNALFLMGIILPYWTIKCLCSLLETPLVYAGVHWLRQGK